MIYVPALAFNQVTGINLHAIALLVCAVCIFYTTLVRTRAHAGHRRHVQLSQAGLSVAGRPQSCRLDGRYTDDRYIRRCAHRRDLRDLPGRRTRPRLGEEPRHGQNRLFQVRKLPRAILPHALLISRLPGPPAWTLTRRCDTPFGRWSSATT